nr:hypothetical protein [Desulfobulbaceae bacterium]
MNAPLRTERRKHDRLSLFAEEASADSMLSGLGSIIEMSSGGFSAEYHGDTSCIKEECKTSIFVRGGTVINNLPIKFEWVNCPENNENCARTTVGVRFQKLTSTQQLKIAALLRWHTQE